LTSALVAAALSLPVLSCAPRVATAAPAADPAKAPPPAAAAIPDVDMNSLAQLLARRRGQPVLVNVFASWCIPCRREMPTIARFTDANPKLVLLGLDVDPDPLSEPARSFIAAVPPAFEVIRAKTGLRPLIPALRLPADWLDVAPEGWEDFVPLTFLYDSRGTFVTGSVGDLSAEAVTVMRGLISEAAATSSGENQPSKSRPSPSR
jgi:thiol-disulfide isomerase/thioredoxin